MLNCFGPLDWFSCYFNCNHHNMFYNYSSCCKKSISMVSYFYALNARLIMLTYNRRIPSVSSLNWDTVPINKSCWLYHNILVKRKKNNILILNWSLFVSTWFPFTQGCLVTSFVEIGPVDLEKFLNFVEVFFLFRYNLLLEIGRGL